MSQPSLSLALGPALAFASALASAPAARAQGDVADVRAEERRAGDDEHKRYFLIGPRADAEAPKGGFRLLVVLPGGDGGADFLAFVKRIFLHATTEEYLVAQLVAPRWSDDQAERLVWPTKKNPWPDMRFTTEEFVDAVIADVEEDHAIDPEYVFTLSWSSGGPAAYAVSLTPETRITGSFVAMSAFKPDELPSLAGAKGQAYFLLHSPDDFIPIAMAEDAQEKLEKKKAEVKLVTYAGGHGWKGDVYGNLKLGLGWLEEHHAKPKRRKG